MSFVPAVPTSSAPSTVVSTRVFSNTASGWKTARKRRAAMSKMRRSSEFIFSSLCSERVGMIAWWSVTFSSLTTRASGSTSSPVTYSAPARYSSWEPTSSAIGLISSTMSVGR